MTTKQQIHIDNLHANKRALYQARLNNILNYDLSFYRFKNGKLNISKMARCSGLSRGFLEKELWRLGL
ncbi:hypothetical protein CCAL13119_03900 [Campylobacter sp. RM13119]|uniref:hypothetical protein n=1 Tax=Campylobacter californiensis TaxID=1032243 RepID=UPI0014744C27|nr:hypothetical protein [Campylobacter sp. RM13119]MBE3606106.1 hypothetical protein [Campylobacter sp. RM13119]